MNIKKFLAVILVTIIAITVFAGCDVITKNEERDYNQSLATVKYAGLTSTVTKGEFNESFNSLACDFISKDAISCLCTHIVHHFLPSYSRLVCGG